MVARRLRELIAMLLLGVLLIGVMPRDLFHDCAAVEHGHMNASAAGALVTADCAVCSLALLVCESEADPGLTAVEAVMGIGFLPLVPQLCGVRCEAPSSRGPPEA